MRKLVVILFFCFWVFPGMSQAHSIEEREMALRKELLAEFDKDLVDRIFNFVRLDESVKTLPGAQIPFNAGEFINGVLSDSSLESGKEYLGLHESSFVAAEEKFGVGRFVIAAILRMETNFGKYLGERLVINTLYSLYMAEPRRRRFALSQLKWFLRISLRNGWDIFSVVGSRAGAFGIAQFIPSSFAHYAVDGNGDGKVDLFRHEDAIFSVANYLKENGWTNDRKKAVFAYNRSTFYVNLVLLYRDALMTAEKRRQ